MRFDTADIARLLFVKEADVCRVIHAVRDVERDREDGTVHLRIVT